MTTDLCSICNAGVVIAKDRCMTCYQYLRRHGVERPDGLARRQSELNYRADQRRQERERRAMERGETKRWRRVELFLDKIDKSGDCWLWTAFIMPNGYGRFGGGHAGSQLAHRVSYELFVGPIPDGLEIDHLCRVKRCVRPDHLEPVTLAENVRRSQRSRMSKSA